MRLRILLIGALLCAMTACGGGGGSASSSSSSSSGGTTPPPVLVDRAVLTYTAPAGPSPSGSTPLFVFTIENPSTRTISNVQLNLTLGAGLTRGSVLCQPISDTVGHTTCPDTFDSTSIATLTALSGVRFSVYVSVAPGLTGTFPISAQLTAPNDDVTTNNSVQFDVPVYSADVSVAAATSASNLVSGDIAPFSITVANAGPDTARGVALTRSLGGRQTTTMTCTANGGATCPATLGADMTVPTLPNGGSLLFSLNSQLATDALASVSASMRAQALGDNNFGNNNAVVSAYVRIPTASTSPTFTKFQSEPGDPAGLGADYSYTRVNSVFELQDYGDYISLGIVGNERWIASFYKPSGLARWQPGIYTDLLGAPFHDPASGGLYVSGPGGGCDQTGWFNISNVVYTGDEITALDVIFAQHCSGAQALRGQIHWVANDGTQPPGPVNPPPTGLWAPAAGSTPASGNYLHLVSAAGEQILNGATETYTQANATFGVTAQSRSLGFRIVGAKDYNGEFWAMSPLTQMQPGYYVIDPQLWSGNPTNPGMRFRSSDRDCLSGNIGGWFVVDSISYNNGDLTGVDARFEQRCDNGPPLRGQLHWRTDDPTQPPGPVAPPAGLWAPPAGAIPATGDVVYLEGMPNPRTGARPPLTYTSLNSHIQPGDGGMTLAGNRFHLDVSGDENWNGDFQAMVSLPDLRVGYYGGVGAYPNHNPVKGGLSWTGSTNCFVTGSWFAIDSIHYSGSTVDAIELRFEEYCGTLTIPIRGYIRWSAADTRPPAPPQNPPPAGLWQPAPGATPATINYVYLVSEPATGPSETFTYTQATAEFVVTTMARGIEFAVHGDERWLGDFVSMEPFTELQPGYYALQNGSNPAKGGLGWQRFSANSCGTGQSWFTVDAVTYQAGVLRSVDLRFERTCLAGDPTVRGKIHWRFDDPTAAPGPVVPPPPGLWQPPDGVVPANGNVLYVEGQGGDYVTGGGTFLFTSGNAFFQGGTGIDEYIVGVQTSNDSWGLNFKPMNSIPRMQPGYYPNSTTPLIGNPTRGRLDVSGRGRACGQFATGWFVVDSVTYVGEQMTSIQMRFEQHCTPGVPGLKGIVRWAQ